MKSCSALRDQTSRLCGACLLLQGLRPVSQRVCVPVGIRCMPLQSQWELAIWVTYWPRFHAICLWAVPIANLSSLDIELDLVLLGRGELEH
jgi:hypothetical protein